MKYRMRRCINEKVYVDMKELCKEVREIIDFELDKAEEERTHKYCKNLPSSMQVPMGQIWNIRNFCVSCDAIPIV